MIRKKLRDNILDYSVGLLVMAAFILMSELFFGSSISDKEKLHLKNEIRTANVQFDIVQRSFNRLSHMLFYHLINVPDMQRMMYEAAHATPKQREVLRKKLYSRYEHLYGHLRENDLRQLHFHLPGSISFLRFHRPQTFGDSLVGVRATVDMAQALRQPVHAFEEGRVFYGFRNVYPIFYGETFCGTVELSYSFNAISKASLKDEDMGYLFIEKRSQLHKKVWSREQKNYLTSSLNPGFVVDREVFHADEESEGLSLSKMEAINKKLAPQTETNLAEGNNFAKVGSLEGRLYSVSFLAVKNLLGENVGYFITYHQDPVYESFADTRVKIRIFVAVGSFLFMILVVLFIKVMRSKFTTLQYTANNDSLTGIYNRQKFNRELSAYTQQATSDQIPLCLILLDIDHFKNFNDQFGHIVGDTVLQEVVRTMRSHLRSSDIFARWGGEEFAIIMPNITVEDAAKRAESLRESVEAMQCRYGVVTCSFGVGQYQEGESSQHFINRIDELLYEAKAQGRNCVIASRYSA